MLLETLNQPLLFMCGIFIGGSTYLFFSLFYMLNKLVKNKVLKGVLDFLNVLLTAVIYILLNYIVNFMQIKWFMLLGNVIAVIIFHIILSPTIAKIKNILYNKKVR